MIKQPRIQKIIDKITHTHGERISVDVMFSIMENQYNITVDKEDYTLIGCLIPFFNEDFMYACFFKACGLRAVWGNGNSNFWNYDKSDRKLYIQHPTTKNYMKYTDALSNIQKHGIVDGVNVSHDLATITPTILKEYTDILKSYKNVRSSGWYAPSSTTIRGGVKKGNMNIFMARSCGKSMMNPIRFLAGPSGKAHSYLGGFYDYD